MTIPYKRESHRKEKIEGLIKQVVSKIILHELNDPRCGFCTVTRVKISNDLKNASIFVSVLGDESMQRTSLRGLKHAKRFIQKRLFQEVNLKHTPSISIEPDHSIEKSIKISRILREEGLDQSGEDEPDGDPEE